MRFGNKPRGGTHCLCMGNARTARAAALTGIRRTSAATCTTTTPPPLDFRVDLSTGDIAPERGYRGRTERRQTGAA